jgi:hypothetical protein
MIELWPDLPDNVLGLTAHGEVSARDYEETLIPAVEDLLARHEKIRLVYHVGADFTGFSAGALWDDAKLGISHFTAWERVALVTDLEWLATAAIATGLFLPSQVKVFPCEHLEEARRWATA